MICPVTDGFDSVMLRITTITHQNTERLIMCVMLVYLQNDLISRWFKQRINYIEKANKEHYQQKSESIKPLLRKMIHCFEALQLDRGSFDSERDFKALFANHLFQSGTSKRVSRIICLRAGLQIIHQRQGCWGGARGGLRGLKPRMFLLHALYASSSLSFHAH